MGWADHCPAVMFRKAALNSKSLAWAPPSGLRQGRDARGIWEVTGGWETGNARQGSQQGAGLQARAVGIWAPPWWEQRKAARRRRDGARGTWGPGAWLDRRMKAGLPGASQREAGRARPGDCLGACCLFLVDPESYQGKDQRSWQSLTTPRVCADSWRRWGRAGGSEFWGYI